MHPVLFSIGRFEAHTYGLLLMFSFLIGIYMSSKRAQQRGVDPNDVFDLSIVIIISSLLGARGLYVVYHLEEFSNNYLDIINPFQSNGSIGIAGMTLLGGVVLAIISSYIYLKYKKLDILQIFNIMTPALALGIGIARIGCFFHGCCFGEECYNSFGMIYPQLSSAGFMYPNTPIHPTQLYASFGGFVIFGILFFVEKQKQLKNSTFFVFLVFYGISRFTVDFFRYYESEMVLFSKWGNGLSLNQVIAIIMFVFGISGIVYLNNYRKQQ